MIYLISDTHFYHSSQVTKGFRPANFEEKIKESLEKIPDNALLIHLGDVSLSREQEVHYKFIQPLKCKKWLVTGNYDSKSDNWYLNRGWDFVGKLFMIDLYGERILFSHKPQKITDKTISLNIHGHFHNACHRWHDPKLTDRVTDKHRLFALEYTNYQTVLLETFLKKAKPYDQELKEYLAKF